MTDAIWTASESPIAHLQAIDGLGTQCGMPLWQPRVVAAIIGLNHPDAE
jgi:hypothetical protein